MPRITDPDEKISRALSKTLRHQAVAQGFKISKEGWIAVEDLLNSDQYKRLGLTLDKLEHVVESNQKKRFEFNSEHSSIRACQGHSLEVDLDSLELLTAETLPAVVIHGTNKQAWQKIKESGLSRMNRLHIHLASGLPGQVISGMRYSSTVFIYVDAQAALQDGIKFYRASNGDILSPGIDGIIPVKYLRAEMKEANLKS